MPDLETWNPAARAALAIFSNGAPNTAMQPWSGKLEDEEIEAMARWIASLEAE